MSEKINELHDSIAALANEVQVVILRLDRLKKDIENLRKEALDAKVVVTQAFDPSAESYPKDWITRTTNNLKIR